MKEDLIEVPENQGWKNPTHHTLVHGHHSQGGRGISLSIGTPKCKCSVILGLVEVPGQLRLDW